jgi:hypothetical protein
MAAVKDLDIDADIITELGILVITREPSMVDSNNNNNNNNNNDKSQLWNCEQCPIEASYGTRSATSPLRNSIMPSTAKGRPHIASAHYQQLCSVF